MSSVMSMTEFRDQDLTGARFEHVNLRGATFTDVYLNDASIRDVDLSGVQIRGALLNRSRMRGVDSRGYRNSRRRRKSQTEVANYLERRGRDLNPRTQLPRSTH